MSQRCRKNTKPGADEAGYAAFPECENQNADSYIGYIVGKEHMTKRKEHSRYQSRGHRLDSFLFCQLAIEITAEENLFVEISAEAHE